MIKKSKSMAPSLERGLNVLEILAWKNQEITFAELLDEIDIPPSSLWRVLNVLKERGYVHFNEKRRVYRLGLQFLYMNNSLMGGIGYRSTAWEYLKRLSRLTGETAELDIRVQDHLVLVEQIEGEKGKVEELYSHPGSSIPYFHATAPGKVYLAEMDMDKVRRVINKLGLQRLTGHTIQDIKKLEKELITVKSKGYAFDFEEMRKGVCRVSAPIYDKEKALLGCFTITSPCSRLKRNSPRKNELGNLVKETADEFTRERGRL